MVQLLYLLLQTLEAGSDISVLTEDGSVQCLLPEGQYKTDEGMSFSK